MSHMNKIIVQGYMGKDPESRFTPTGKKVTTFSLGSSTTRKVNGEPVKKTTWFKVVTWEGLAEIVEKWGKKGMPVLVEGVLNANDEGNPTIWEKKDGTPASNFEITAREVFMSFSLGDKKSATEEELGQVEEDAIPF